jgi:DNA-binding XRE family transcriptional regulator/uncharacterized phage-associated protein
MATWIKTGRKSIGVSQEDMAKSLGISRPTYIKIENGLVKPTDTQKSQLARLLSVSAESLEKKLSASSFDISSDTQVREVPVENSERFKEVFLYLLGKVGSRPNVGQTVLYKLLYFIDFDYYEKYEEQLIGATYIRNTFGPTPVSFAKLVKEMEEEGRLVTVNSKFFDKDQTKYIPVAEADVSVLSGQELKHIDDEIERLAHFTAKQLSELSHKDTPWLVAKDREVLNYEHVFYRSDDTRVREYEPL